MSRRPRPPQLGPVAGPASMIRVGRSPHYASHWPGRGSGRAAFLATGPSLWYDARDLLSITQATLASRVGAGTATLTNGPVALTHSSNYVYLPGTSGNYLSTPYDTAYDVTDDLEIVCRVSLTDWTPASSGAFVSKAATAYELFINAGSVGTLALRINNTSYDSTAAVAATDGDTIWLRATRVKATGAINFYQAADSNTEPTSWTQIGATVTGNTTAMPVTTVGFGVGARAVGPAGSVPISGRLYRMIVRNTTAGTTVFNLNPAVETLGQASWTCTTGQPVTVNRSTSGATTAVVTRPRMMLDGSNDYIGLAAGDTPTFTPAAGSETVMLVTRVHNLAGAATLSRVWSSESASNVGAHIYLDQANAQYKVLVGGASTTATTAAVAFTQTTQLHAVAAVFAAGTAYAYSTTTGLTAGTSYGSVGTIVHTTPRIGSRADSVATPADLEVFAFVRWARALTASELATAASYLTGTYS